MRPRRRRSTLAALAVAVAFTAAPAGAANQVIYDNSLRNGWQDWSWAAHSLTQTLVFRSAPSAISWEPDAVGGDWQGVYFHSDPNVADPATTAYSAVRFWISGAGGNQAVRLAIYRNNVEVGSKDLTPLPTVWTQVTVTWAELGVAAPAIDGIVFQTNVGADQATAYIDDLELVEGGGGPPPGGPVTVAVDPNLDRRAVNPLRVYLKSSQETGRDPPTSREDFRWTQVERSRGGVRAGPMEIQSLAGATRATQPELPSRPASRR